MAINRNTTDRIPLTFPKSLTNEVDAYVSLNKNIKTRAKAVRILVKKGLEAEYNKNPELEVKVNHLINDQMEE